MVSVCLEPGQNRSYIAERLIEAIHQELHFIESAQFMLSSLEKLVNATPKGDMCITNEYETDPEKRALLPRKRIYAYKYVVDWSRFDEKL